jgi:hypothetical protein
MDPTRFDQLSRIFAATPSRRSALAGLTGTLTALVTRLLPSDASDVNAAPKVCRPLGKLCFPDRGIGCCRGATCQNGRCRCPKRARRCGSHCLPKSKCCRHKDCPGNQRCQKGRCRCPAGKKRCQQRCIEKNACCRNGECGPHEACVRGACACAPGAKRCGDACIPEDGCCQTSDCGEDQNCENHACVAKRCGAGAPCRVFISSDEYQGDLGGVAGADAKCQELANNSDLTRGGAYKAWISGSSPASSPSQRFTNRDQTGPYVLVDFDGTVVAEDWDDLTTLKGDEYLRARLDRTEHGSVYDSHTWTHTQPDGSPGGPGGAHCQEWTSDSSDDEGDRGFCAYRDGRWTEHGTQTCNVRGSLYCFEQG